MGAEIPIGLLIASGATAAAGAGASFIQAQEQNKAIDRANKSAADQRAAEQAQIDAAASQRKEQLAAQYALYEGSARVNAADRSVSVAQSTTALQKAALGTALTDESTIDFNSFLQINSLNSSTAARLADNNSRRRIAGLDAFSGGLAGLQAGVGLYSGIKAASSE